MEQKNRSGSTEQHHQRSDYRRKGERELQLAPVTVLVGHRSWEDGKGAFWQNNGAGLFDVASPTCVFVVPDRGGAQSSQSSVIEANVKQLRVLIA